MSNVKWIVGAVALFFLLILAILLNPLVEVAATDRGVVLNFGAATQIVLEPGLHFRIPFQQKVVKIPIQQQVLTVEGSNAYTKDGQTVTINSSLLYAIDPQHVRDLYVDLGLAYETKIVRPVMEESVKTEVAKFTAIEIPTHRPDIQQAVEAYVREKLSPHFLIVSKYTFVNEDFSDAYEAAINAKQVAEQKSKQAEYETKTVEQEKQQSILQAQAVAEKSRLEAEALSNTASADSLIKKLQMEAFKEFATHWKGDVPGVVIMGGQTPLPFFNLDSLMKK